MGARVSAGTVSADSNDALHEDKPARLNQDLQPHAESNQDRAPNYSDLTTAILQNEQSKSIFESFIKEQEEIEKSARKNSSEQLDEFESPQDLLNAYLQTTTHGQAEKEMYEQKLKLHEERSEQNPVEQEVLMSNEFLVLKAMRYLPQFIQSPRFKELPQEIQTLL